MQRDEVATLPVVPTYVNDIWSLLLPLAKDKTVLNVGAAGNVEDYLAGRRDFWMHERVKDVAREVIGLDVDEDSVAYANARGEGLLLGNCENAQLNRKFDLIVLSEVIEHVNAPAQAVTNLVEHLNPNGKLFITTPNPTYYGSVLRALFNIPMNVYYDHVTAFFPENLVVLCRRLDLKISSIHYFNDRNIRVPGLKFRLWVALLIGRLFHRLSSNFIVIVDASES